MPNLFTHKNSQGTTYYLNVQEVQLRNGGKSIVYFFSKTSRGTSIADLPSGYEIVESPRSHMPVLKKTK